MEHSQWQEQYGVKAYALKLPPEQRTPACKRFLCACELDEEGAQLLLRSTPDELLARTAGESSMFEASGQPTPELCAALRGCAKLLAATFHSGGVGEGDPTAWQRAARWCPARISALCGSDPQRLTTDLRTTVRTLRTAPALPLACTVVFGTMAAAASASQGVAMPAARVAEMRRMGLALLQETLPHADWARNLEAQFDLALDQVQWVLQVAVVELTGPLLQAERAASARRKLLREIDGLVERQLVAFPTRASPLLKAALAHLTAGLPDRMAAATARLRRGLGIARQASDELHHPDMAWLLGAVHICNGTDGPMVRKQKVEDLAREAQEAEAKLASWRMLKLRLRGMRGRHDVRQWLRRHADAPSKALLAPEVALFQAVSPESEAAGRYTCANCGQTTLLKACARCKAVGYCSRICQKEHWRNHKPSCRPADGMGVSDATATPAAYCCIAAYLTDPRHNVITLR